MNIVVLDGYTLNPGDLGWERLEEMASLTVYDRTPSNLILERSAETPVLLTNKTPLGADTLAKLPKLRYIGVLATGYNIVDVRAATGRGIVVTNVPTYGTRSVAQMTFALLLELCHHVQAHNDEVRRGEWSRSPDFCFWRFPLVELADKTLGIIGFGRIGRQVAQIAGALGMRVIAYDTVTGNPPALEGFRWTSSVDELLANADVVSLHCPLTPENTGLINRQSIAKMKLTTFLINTSRGGLVKDEDLAEALNSERIAGAGLDVLSVEPPKPDNPLLGAKNCLITPHIAWASRESRTRLLDIAVENVRAFLAGKPVNVVKGQ